jgi:hypothetical protein
MFELGGIRTQLQEQLAGARATGSRASTDDWVRLVGSCQEVLSVVAALQTVALAQIAARDEVALEDGTVVEEFRGLGHQRLDAPALVDDLLGLSAAAASDRVSAAVDLVTRHPQLVGEMAAGRLDAYRAGVVAAELREADPEVCRHVDSVVVERLRATRGAEAAGPLRRRTRRTLERVDPELVRRLADRARGERSLRRSAWAPGVDEWSATLPVEQSRSAWSVVDGLARSYVSQGRCTGLETARADALMDLIHARATGQVSVQLTVPASEVARHAVDPSTVLAAGPQGAELDALVPVTAFGMPGVTHVRASWLAGLPGAPLPSLRTRLRGHGSRRPGTATAAVSLSGAMPASVEVLACDDLTGALTTLPLGQDASPTSDSYRPPAWMVAFVRARDGGCRFPGCSVSARSCDLDHVRAWPHGPTDPTNLICLCRRQHRNKQRPGWSVTVRPDAVVTWVDPTGRGRTTYPTDHLHTTAGATLAERIATVPTAAPAPLPHPVRASLPASSSLAASSAPTVSSALPASVPVLPSLLEDEVTHDLERGLIARACRSDTISQRNRRALRRGERIRASDPSPTRPHEAAHGVARESTGSRRRQTIPPRDDEPPF